MVCSHGDVIPDLLRILKATTARFRDPFIWPKLLDGISEYLLRHNVARIADLVGTVEAGPKGPALHV